MPQRNTIVLSKENMKVFTKIPNLPECFEFALQIVIQNTSISRAKRQNFNRAPNFVGVFRLCTIHSTSNFQAETLLRVSFLRNSCQWQLSNVSYFLEREKQKQFNTSYLHVLDMIEIL